MRSRLLATVGAVTLAAAGALTFAPTASANQTWIQSVGRSSATAPCPADSAAETAAGWTDWTPSWEQWANNGTGGYVCTRSNTWAYESDGSGGYPSAGCVGLDPFNFVDFEGGWSLGPSATDYEDAGCTIPTSPIGLYLVYAPGGPGQAVALCDEAFGTSPSLEFANNAWSCSTE